MTVLITGANGFAGSHLTEYLLHEGESVVALVREGSELKNLQHILPQLRIERADLRDGARVLQLLQQIQPQRIYHLAAFSSPAESLRRPKEAYEVNFWGTFNLLFAVRQLDFPCRFLQVSSSDVYGTAPPCALPLQEVCPFQPANPYAASKAATELLAFQFFKSYGLPIVRVRPFNHTGPRQSAAFVCSSFARQIIEIELGLRPPAVETGNLKVLRDFSDVRDVVRGYVLVLEKGEPGEVYHLCSARPISIGAVLDILLQSASRPIRVIGNESRLRPGEASEIWGDFSKARQAVGWEPQYSLEETLRDLKIYWKEVLVAKQGLP